MTSQVLKAGQERAKTFLSTYARIELLRPYFDVDPQQIRYRYQIMMVTVM